MNLFVALGATLAGCEKSKETVDEGRDIVEDVFKTEVSGQVTDNRGQPVGGATVRLYNLLGNTHFVEGSDITSAEAYIDREAVLASNNSVANAETRADGHFTMSAFPTAFLAVATGPACTAGFAGFDEETGILNADTLITPNFSGGLNFVIPGFVLACATPPDVGPEGNSAEAPAFEPPVAPVVCDEQSCLAAGGTCDGETCAMTCNAESCGAVGGTCAGGACTTTACDPTACTAEGGTCAADGLSCELPACSSDEDCQAGQPGAFCSNAGDVALAACNAPLPGEVIAPPMAMGWTAFFITDTADNLLADATTDNQMIAAADVPADGLVRVFGTFGGDAATAYVHVQSGSQRCPDVPPRTDYIAVDIVDGNLATSAGNFLEVALHGGQEKIQLSTSGVSSEGDRSFTVEVGDECAWPTHPFIATLSWDAGPGEPADLDLNVWNAAGELVFVGNKQAAWGRLVHEGKGPGPEVFESDDVAQGPFTVKVQFFSGRPRDVEGKLRVIRSVAGQLLDDTFVFTVSRPKDVAEIGVFASQ